MARSLVCLLALSVGPMACTDANGDPTPEADGGQTNKAKDDRPPPDPETLPKLDTQPRVVPTKREGDQLAEADLEALLEQVDAKLEADMTLLKHKKRRMEAIYYLTAAARVDDPKAEAALYDELAVALKRQSQFDDAASAWALASAREPTPERSLNRARALTSIPDRRIEGADEIARVRATNDDLDLLFEEAVIRGQVPGEFARSVELFTEYKKRSKGSDLAKLPEGELDLRIAELEQLIKAGKDVPTEPGATSPGDADGQDGKQPAPSGSVGAKADPSKP
jgi:hypothetical protein